MSQVLKINPNQYWPESSSLKTASEESKSQLLILCTEAVSLEGSFEHYTHPGTICPPRIMLVKKTLLALSAWFSSHISSLTNDLFVPHLGYY